MNLPNSLTITRIFLVPLLVVVLLTKFEGRMILGVRMSSLGPGSRYTRPRQELRVPGDAIRAFTRVFDALWGAPQDES